MKFNMTLRGDIAPAGTQERLHIALLLGMIRPFFSRQLYRLVLVCEKRPPLLVPLGAMGIEAALFFLSDTDPCEEEIRPPTLSSARFIHRLATSNEMGAVKRLETMGSFGCKHLCSVFSSALKPTARENLGHRGRC